MSITPLKMHVVLAPDEGLLCGISAGAAFAGAGAHVHKPTSNLREISSEHVTDEKELRLGVKAGITRASICRCATSMLRVKASRSINFSQKNGVGLLPSYLGNQ